MPISHACRTLPFGETALEPVISARTLAFHHGKHYSSYIANVNAAVAQTAALRDQSLTQLLLASSSTPGTLFNNVAQAWNHEFYFDGLAPCDQGGDPGPDLLAAITRHSGSLAELKAELVRCATGHFGSGWAWLVRDGAQLAVYCTHDAGNPLVRGHVPLWTLDVWEHAYYLDHQNARGAYCEAVVARLLDWNVVTRRWAESRPSSD